MELRSEEKRVDFDKAVFIKGQSMEEMPEKKPGPIENLELKPNREISLFKTLALDIIIPGGGHFYRGDYANGFIFSSIKLAGGYSVYYLYKKRESAESDYRSVRSSNGSAGTVDRERRHYDRASQLVTFSMISYLIVFFVSATINYNGAVKINENSSPSFDVYGSHDGRFRLEPVIEMRYKFRI